MTTHVLKVWPELYVPLAEGAKTFELRHRGDADAPIEPGDVLELVEWTRPSPVPGRPPAQADDPGHATGRKAIRAVTYVLDSDELRELGLPYLERDVIAIGLTLPSVSPLAEQAAGRWTGHLSAALKAAPPGTVIRLAIPDTSLDPVAVEGAIGELSLLVDEALGWGRGENSVIVQLGPLA